jgi:hypothetical protein
LYENLETVSESRGGEAPERMMSKTPFLSASGIRYVTDAAIDQRAKRNPGAALH